MPDDMRSRYRFNKEKGCMPAYLLLVVGQRRAARVALGHVVVVLPPHRRVRLADALQLHLKPPRLLVQVRKITASRETFESIRSSYTWVLQALFKIMGLRNWIKIAMFPVDDSTVYLKTE